MLLCDGRCWRYQQVFLGVCTHWLYQQVLVGIGNGSRSWQVLNLILPGSNNRNGLNSKFKVSSNYMCYIREYNELHSFQKQFWLFLVQGKQKNYCVQHYIKKIGNFSFQINYQYKDLNQLFVYFNISRRLMVNLQAHYFMPSQTYDFDSLFVYATILDSSSRGNAIDTMNVQIKNCYES